MANEGFEAGSIFIALKASVDGFMSGLKQATSALTTFGKDVGNLASRVTNFGKQLGNALLAPVRAVNSLVSSLFTLKAIVGALIVSQTFKLLVTGPAEAAVELERMAARAGIAADQLERLQFVVSAAGGRGDDVSIGLEKLNRILDDTRKGSEDFLPVLRELGFEGLSLSEIIDKVLKNPNLGAAGLKKLGVSELAVLTKLSREEVDKLLVSFVKLGNGTDSELFKLGSRLQVVKTQLKEAFGNIAENVTKLVLPHLLDALEAVEKFIEAHFPEILAFFDTLGQQVALFFDAVKKTAEVPTDLAFALQQATEAIFVAIGNIVISSFDGFVKIGVESFKAFGAAIIVLFGPLFTQIWGVLKIQLDFLTDKAGLLVRKWFNILVDTILTVIRTMVNEVLDVMQKALNALAEGLEKFGGISGIVLAKGIRNLTALVDQARRANLAAAASENADTAETMADLARQEVIANEKRLIAIRNLADEFQGMSDETTKFALDLFIANCAEIAKQTNMTIKEITGEVLGAVEAVGNAFGFKLSGVGTAFDANLAKRQAEQKQQLKPESALVGPALPPNFVDTTSPEALKALSRQLQENDAKAAADRKKEQEEFQRQLEITEAKLNRVIGGVFEGIHSAFNQIFIEGTSTLEALGNVARKISDEFIGDTLKKLQDGLSKGLAGAFNDPAVGGAVADLAGALIGIAATVFSIFQSKKSSKKSFGKVDDIVNSSQAIRGVVAGPESVAIAAVGESIKDAFVPTENLLGRILRAIERGGGKGASDGDFEFVTIPTG